MRARTALAWVLSSAATVAAAHGHVPRECRVSAPAAVSAGQPVRLRFVLRNPGPQAVHVLAWGLPFEGWFAPFVSVWRDGSELAYQGPSLKRGEPAADEYLRIAAGRARVAVVDLGQAFDLTPSGRYRVAPQLTVHDAFTAGAGVPPRPRERHAGQAVACTALEFSVAPAAGPKR